MPAKKKPDPAPEDEGLVIELDPDTFNRAERKELQDKYGLPFVGLVEFVEDGMFRAPIRVQQDDDTWTAGRMPLPEPILAGDPPEKVWPDDVLIDMTLIQARRNGAEINEDSLAALGQPELRAAIERGRRGKASKPDN